MYLSFAFLALQGLISVFIVRMGNLSSEAIQNYSVVVIALNCIVAIVDIFRKKNTKKINLILFLAFVFRIFLFIWDVNFSDIFRFPDSGLDSAMFEGAAADGYNGLGVGRGGALAQTAILLIYNFFGVQPLVFRYFNILLSMSALFVIQGALRKLDLSTNTINFTIIIAAFFPYVAMNCTLFLRETIIQFLVACSMYYFISWFKNSRKKHLVFSMVFCCVAAVYHSGAVAIALGYVMCLILYNREQNKFVFTRNSVAIAVACLMGFMIINATIGDEIFSKFGSIEDVSDITYQADVRNSGGGAYTATIVPGDSILALIVNTPVRMFYFLFSPVPWLWRGASDILSFMFNASLYIYTIYGSVILIRKNEAKNLQFIIAILIIGLASAAIFSWGVSNSGAAMRHRDKFMAVYFILFALVIENNKIKRIVLK